MGRHKWMDHSQGNTMEQYTAAVPLPQRPARSDGSGDGVRVLATSDEPSRAELLTAIQGSRVALEIKTETLAVEVNLLRAYIQKVSDKVKVAEGSIVELPTEVGALRKQMVQATSAVGRQGGRSHFFEPPEEVWRWLEMWDKVVPGRTEGAGGVASWASGAEGPDWRA
ncbi:hypothetical protein NDU88_002962 [Pleurodeles waltl]|uniref:Uncharacterized protein n=1 Tax=Pleurodeles waltl TaxID=8319 RepID=A0AAV7WQ61_PLEWA|nr:hypothetical protein NDU88_002962 [Pleurodeles waltl]